MLHRFIIKSWAAVIVYQPQEKYFFLMSKEDLLGIHSTVRMIIRFLVWSKVFTNSLVNKTIHFAGIVTIFIYLFVNIHISEFISKTIWRKKNHPEYSLTTKIWQKAWTTEMFSWQFWKPLLIIHIMYSSNKSEYNLQTVKGIFPVYKP